MASASLNRMVFWTDLEGTELNGRWTLVRQVRSEGRTGWFEAKEADGRPVMLIITETLNDEDELLERLHAAAAIRHPNVVRIEDSQLVQLEDTPMVIAVTELTEENLADVLRDRALGAEEARQIFDSLLAGLAAIHERGLIHGRMEPGSVLATGDTIKLRSDCVHSAPENFAAAAGEDVRGLGRIVVQTMTRRIPSGENDPLIQLVPEPMARAVRRSLSGRAAVDEIATLAGIRIVPPRPAAPAPKPAAKVEKIESPSETAPSAPVSAPEGRPSASGSAPASAIPPAPPAPPQVVTTQVVEPVRTAVTPEAATSAPKLPPAAAIELQFQPDEPKTLGRESNLLLEEEEQALDRRHFSPWIVIAAVALAIITIFVLYGIFHHGPAKQSPAPTTAPATSTSGHHAAVLSKPAPSVPQNPAATLTAPAGPGWRVVTYTYDRQKDAEQKAASLQQRYPRLQIALFAARTRGPYLVTVGGVMTKAAALQMRQKAVRMGLPRDTYVQNFR